MEATQTEARTRFTGADGPRLLGPEDGKYQELRSVGVRFMAWTAETGGGFSLVEHPMHPKTLVAPLHRHSREDEYSYVLEGRMAAILGDELVYADEGDFVFKPRNQWHTFWNPTDEPARILEIIAPGGFEGFFDEFGDLIAGGDFSPEKLGPLGAKYGLEFDPESVPALTAEHGLTFPNA